MRKDYRNIIYCYHFLLLSSFVAFILAHEDLLSCLTSNGVHNYTTLSTDHNQKSEYYNLLYATIQNPVFKKPAFNKPAAIVLPQSKDHLASTIICCRRGSWTIRLRSGGHSYEGWSHIADTPFVIIDLMKLNGVEINLEDQTAWVESGATLGELYHKIGVTTDSFGFSAGYCPTVGSGGHISGGGFGMMSRKYGLAADNVVDALLIDANGNVQDRKSMGEDVFWAIRGGGGGALGAIYAWKIQLLPVPKKVTAFKLMKRGMTLKEASQLLHKHQYVAPELEDRFTTTLLAGSDQNGIWIQLLGLYLGSKAEALSTMNQVFPELHSPDEFLEVSWLESVVYTAGVNSADDLKNRFLKWEDRAFKAKVDFLKEHIPLEGVRGLLEWLMKEPRGFIAVNGFNGAMSKISSDATPFPHRNGTLLMFEYIVAWEMEDDCKSIEFLNWLSQFYEYMGQFIKEKPRLSYVNHVDVDLGAIDWRNSSMAGNAVEISREWGERYFSSNYDRLVRAKTLIDPNNVFHHPQSIPPLPTIDVLQTCETMDAVESIVINVLYN